MMNSKYLILLFLLCIPVAAAQLTFSPGCSSQDAQGKCTITNVTNDLFEMEYRVYNKDAQESDFLVYIESDTLKEYSIITPDRFVLTQYTSGNCGDVHGCQIVHVKINTTALEPGAYNGFIVAETTTGSQGTLALTLQAKSQLNLYIPERPVNITKWVLSGVVIILLIIALFVAWLFRPEIKRTLKQLKKR